MSRIYLPEPHAKQWPILASEARFKVVRAGRRFGKDRLALYASVVGHGPEGEDGRPRWPGIAQGVDVAWVGPDYPQIRAIWREEVEPRFGGLAPQVALHRQERRLTIAGGGALEFRSAENIDSLRGRRLGGCVLNEAAHFDLEYALKDVILPALLDLGGWVIIISTPNAGPDGHEEAEGKRTPSFFNVLCERIQAGDMPREWAHWHYTTRDNPLLSAREVDALYSQYPEGSPELAQELDAKLIVAGAGVAFPEWADDAHIARYEPPRHAGWRWSGGGDWGYERMGVLYLIATGPERSLVRLEYVFRRTDPYKIGYTWGKLILPYPRPEWFAIDTPAVSDGGPTILEDLQRGLRDAVGVANPPVFINPPKGPGSRLTKKQLLHRELRYTRLPDGSIPPWGYPRLQVHPDCTELIRTLPRLPRDPKNMEDVDTDAADDPYDAITSWLMARTPHVERERQRRQSVDEHPGFRDGRRVDAGRPAAPWDEDIEPGPRWQRVPEEVG